MDLDAPRACLGLLPRHPLELLEEDTSVWLIKGEDVVVRPLADRVERFATTVTKKLRVFDFEGVRARRAFRRRPAH